MSLTALLDSTECVNNIRAVLADFDASSTGRWSDQTILQWVDQANKRIVRDVLFPDSRIEQPTVPNVQLYRFPLMLKTDRVYIGGQLVFPTDVPTLEGQQIGYRQPVAPGGVQSPYADVPNNSGTVNQPAWTVTSPLSYPSTQGEWVTPAPDASPWYCGSPARYYWRGGWLGIVPIPTNANPVTTIAVEGVRQPDTINQMGQAMSSPENFLPAIQWGAVVNAKFSDNGDRAERQMQIAEQFYEREKRKLLEWRGLYPGEQRNGPKVNTLRPLYSYYHTRRAYGGGYRGRGW